MTAIREALTGVVANKSHPVGVHMLFDPADPVAFGFEFAYGGRSVTWWMCRRLVFDASCGKSVGDLDVTWWPVSRTRIGLRLSSPDGVEEYSVPTAPLLNFVRHTSQIVPRGREQKQVGDAVDALLRGVSS